MPLPTNHSPPQTRKVANLAKLANLAKAANLAKVANLAKAANLAKVANLAKAANLAKVANLAKAAELNKAANLRMAPSPHTRPIELTLPRVPENMPRCSAILGVYSASLSRTRGASSIHRPAQMRLIWCLNFAGPLVIRKTFNCLTKFATDCSNWASKSWTSKAAIRPGSAAKSQVQAS